MNRPLLIIGGGGHASVLVDILKTQGREILAFFSPDEIVSRSVFQTIPHFLNDDEIYKFDSNEIKLVNGIGSLPGDNLRYRIYEKFSKLGYLFETVVSSDASVSDYADLMEGVQVMSGATIQAGTKISDHSIINTGAVVDHDCSIGEFNHIAPGAILCGGVTSASHVHIGAAATIIQSIRIGDKSVVGAGALVIEDVAENTTVYTRRTADKVSKKNES